MVAAIGSNTLTSPSVAVPSTGGLEAQIVRYQKQLSDCVNCDSAKTSEGKAAIQAISDKISAAKARIEEINVTNSVNQAPRAASQALATTGKQDVATITPVGKANGGSIDQRSASTNTVGSVINVLA